MPEQIEVRGKVNTIDKDGRIYVSLDDLLIIILKARGALINADRLASSLENLKQP